MKIIVTNFSLLITFSLIGQQPVTNNDKWNVSEPGEDFQFKFPEIVGART